MNKIKQNKKIITHTLIIVAIILLAAVSLQAGFAATTYNINNTTSGGINETLAINATAGDIIELDEGTYTGNNNTNIEINKNITIQGKTKDKVILDAQGLSRIFTIAGNLNVTFINITFINGNSSGYGGAISNNNGNTMMTIQNCKFINNSGYIGAAIYTRGDLTISYSTFENNNVSESGGGVFFESRYQANTLYLLNSTFIGNEGYNGAGGINIVGMANSTIINSTFSNNIARRSGGGGLRAINTVNSSQSSFLSITNSVFNDNFVEGSVGGGLYIATNNDSRIKVTIRDSTIANNTALAGPGIEIQSAGGYFMNTTIINCVVANNSANLNGVPINPLSNFSVRGGGGIRIYCFNHYQDNNMLFNNVDIYNSTIVNNSAGTGGGVAVVVNGSAICNLNIYDSNITNNSAVNDGGGISSANYTDSNYVGENGSKITINIENSEINNNKAGFNGGAIYNGVDVDYAIENCTLINNTANYGGSIYNEGNMAVKRNIMAGNNATILGQMIYNNGTMGILNLTFINNSTYVAINGSTVTIYATLTDDMGNTVTGQNINIYINGLLGGVLVRNIESIEGNASFNITVYGEDGDLFPVNGTYNGTGSYSININEGLLNIKLPTNPTPLNITKIPTNKTLDIAKNIKIGKNTVLKSRLTDESGNPIANAVVDFYVNGEKVGSAVTDSDGVARLNYAYTKTGKHTVTSKYAGNETYLASTANGQTIVSKTQSKLTIKVKDNKITATLTDENGNPLVGKKIVFRVKGVVIGFGITDSNGQVTIYYKNAEQYSITASFAGDTNNTSATATSTPIKSESEFNSALASQQVAMKKTGLPIIPAILALLASLVIIGYRKGKYKTHSI